MGAGTTSRVSVILLALVAAITAPSSAFAQPPEVTLEVREPPCTDQLGEPQVAEDPDEEGRERGSPRRRAHDAAARARAAEALDLGRAVHATNLRRRAPLQTSSTRTTATSA